MGILQLKSQAAIRKMFLMVVCVLSAGGLYAQSTVTLRPVDSGRSVTFNIGPGNAYDRFAVKTNLLYMAALTPNLGFEAGLGARTSLEIAGGFSSWANGKMVKGGDIYPDKKIRSFKHFTVKPEFRYWLRERFAGHFLGVHAFYADYRIGGINIPLLFEKEYYYDGNAYGGGLTYGYLWKCGRRWGIEFSLGVGAMQMKYEKKVSFEGNPEGIIGEKTYFGPTNAGIKLVFLIK